MALSFSGFKQILFDAERKNEGNNAYNISNAGITGSGWSYGWLQFDLINGPAIAKTTFNNILRNAYSISVANSLYAAALSPGGTGLTAQQIIQINAALSSAYGIQAIDNATSTRLDYFITQTNALIAKAPSNDKTFLQSDLGMRATKGHPKNSKFLTITHRVGYIDGCGKETNNKGSQSEE